MSDGHPSAGAAQTPARPGHRAQGWLLRLLRRVTRAALWPELDRIDGDLAAVTALATAVQRHLDSRFDEAVGAVADLRQAYLATRSEFEEVRDHRLVELADGIGKASEATVAAVADLRQAYLATRSEFEEVRDHRLVELADGIGKVSESAAAAVAELRQAYLATRSEFEEVRDHRLVELGEGIARLSDITAAVADLREAYLATRSEFEEVRDHRLVELADGIGKMSEAATAVQGELELLRDSRIPMGEAAVAVLQSATEALQRELELLRDDRIPRTEAGLKRMQEALDTAPATIAGVQALAEELRDRRLPALSARTDALVERLYEELCEVAGLTERVARHEPLHIAVEPAIEAGVPAAVATASRSFADEFRGTRGEILARTAEHVRLLGAVASVLDLGCGRGELLEALRDAGIEARGVDADPAMVAACRRLGLAVDEGDVLAALREAAPGSLGAVTAIHIVEHLPTAAWMALVEGAAAALRPGGILLIESPNPESLRVGAGLFWLDPTHRAPVHPEALAFVARALGLEVMETRFLHPFPPDQALANASQPKAVRELATRLDGWLSGPRDYLLIARKP